MSRIYFSILVVAATAFVGTSATKYGEPCITHFECRLDTPGPLSACEIGPWPYRSCWCNSTVAVPNLFSGVCVPKAEHVGEACEVTDQCKYSLGRYSVCTGTCTCMEGTIPNAENNECVPSKKVGEVCTMNIECPDNWPGTEPNKLGYCSDAGICTCNTYAVTNPAKDRCLRIVSYGHYCEYDEQCQAGKAGPLSECQEFELPSGDLSTRCQCNSNSEIDEGYVCVPKQ